MIPYSVALSRESARGEEITRTIMALFDTGQTRTVVHTTHRVETTILVILCLPIPAKSA